MAELYSQESEEMVYREIDKKRNEIMSMTHLSDGEREALLRLADETIKRYHGGKISYLHKVILCEKKSASDRAYYDSMMDLILNAKMTQFGVQCAAREAEEKIRRKRDF